jgi:hypothetical protein
MRQSLFDHLDCIITATEEGVFLYKTLRFRAEDAVVWKARDGSDIRTDFVMIKSAAD